MGDYILWGMERNKTNRNKNGTDQQKRGNNL